MFRVKPVWQQPSVSHSTPLHNEAMWSIFPFFFQIGEPNLSLCCCKTNPLSTSVKMLLLQHHFEEKWEFCSSLELVFEKIWFDLYQQMWDLIYLLAD